MSSFHKTLDTSHSIDGIKVKNNLPHVSSGIPSLDHIVGGSLPSGGIFLVEEDTLGNYSRVLCKYFLAEGVACKHALFVASADEEPKDIVEELPIPCQAAPEDEVAPATAGMDKMKIAWRYQGLQTVESSFGNGSFGHHFDLSKHVDKDTLNKCDITYWRGSARCENSSFHNSLYQDLLRKLRTTLAKEQFRKTGKGGNILRVCLHSLGSPAWAAADDDRPRTLAEDLTKFLFALRVLIRDTGAVVLVTLPTHLFEDPSLVKRLLYIADNAIRLESFAGSTREANPVFKEYSGLLHVTRLSAVHSLVSHVPPSLDLAFKLRRKKFVIEKLHLPPELEESSEREQDDITATPSCGGFKKKDIDF